MGDACRRADRESMFAKIVRGGCAPSVLRTRRPQLSLSTACTIICCVTKSACTGLSLAATVSIAEVAGVVLALTTILLRVNARRAVLAQCAYRVRQHTHTGGLRSRQLLLEEAH